MAGKLMDGLRLSKALGWSALAAAIMIPATFAGTAMFGTFDVDLERRENIADLKDRKALAKDLVGVPTRKPNALLTKPLFVATRLPFNGEMPPQARPLLPVQAEDVTPPAYRVGGIMITARSRKVLLRTPELSGGQWLIEGDVTAQGWTVSSIDGNRVALARGTHRIAFELYASR
jgi:hypothetical protein